jgi:hypothetical protein
METRSEARSENLHNTGWGFAAFITLVALLALFTAWYIHHTTYRSPRDYMFRQRGDATPTGGEAAHAAPKTETPSGAAGH